MILLYKKKRLLSMERGSVPLSKNQTVFRD